ncbi:DNA translocase FtsK [Halopseudomonas xinjiangensis]|uniref:DNA translocase FtsK n=1 Tax=Halopseudomonas xinjiangensis TaxID=487184 RepID=A0A1H1RA50_9GAMM|nr:DNA translocase FtsK [Halopseudomonas xinjiangensis]SDS32657.1 DNA translocase FtsK [Halopseudomonas xinjiangensis]
MEARILKDNQAKKAHFAWREQLTLRLREGALLAMIALCLYLCMALFTYSTVDPGWTRSGDVAQVQNAGGRMGAWIADVLLLVLGYLAFLFPLIVAVKVWQMFRRRHLPFIWNGWLFSWRLIGFVLTVFAGTALAALHGTAPADFPDGASAGGVLGQLLSDLARPVLNMQGSTLLFLTLFLFGLTVFTNLSWFRVMDVTGRLTLDLFDLLRRGWGAWQARRQAGKADRNPPARSGSVAAPRPAQRAEPVFNPEEQRRAEASRTQRQESLAKHVAAQGSRQPPEIVPPEAKPVEASARLHKEKQSYLFTDSVEPGSLPPISLLDPASKKQKGFSPESLEGMSRLLELKLKDFGVEALVEKVQPGPVITRFEIQPAAGVKVSKISNLAKDLARSLAVISVRVVEVIPGKTTVGIEIPNEDREIVRLSEVLETREFDEAQSPVTLALGHDIGGHPIMADLAKMPHLLVAGTTGSGKSVGVNAMLLSILFKSHPDEVRLIMIDPKMLELSIYEGIPHLLTPVVTDMKEASNALRWCVAEMERRYKLMAAMGVRNLAGFNRKVKDAQKAGTPLTDPLYRRESMDDVPPELESLPIIVVVIDEFADMMMIVGKKVEELIARIAQKARAAGIHLVLATQRPSVDVITGLIKANIPTRMAFQVSSKIDSRTILDQGGAEQLLGHGDMLYMPPGTSLPMRVHGAFVSDEEVHRLVDEWKKRGAPNYIEDILAGADDGGGSYDGGGSSGGDGDAEEDALYDEAVRFVTESRRASISAVQRKLKIGYNRAARMIESMEMAGVVTSMNTNGSREVIAPPPVRD